MANKRQINDIDSGSISKELPRELCILEYSTARLTEIRKLTSIVKDNSGSKNVFQNLPRHMRRRAASHNIKRLPCRVRHIALKACLEAGSTNKRPSRKHRRRPSNLLAEYTRRQRRVAWLETHIWHAKRFHMVERWGYKLPLHPNDKSLRASHRAVTRHCLLQDMSYMSCVEVAGEREYITSSLSKLTSPDTGLSFAATCTEYGPHEGSAFLFSHTTRRPIGPATFIWRSKMKQVSIRPQETTTQQHVGDFLNATTAAIWIWLHPSIYTDVVDELKAIFDLKPREAVPPELSPANTDVPMINDSESLVIADTDINVKSANKSKYVDKKTKYMDPRTVVVTPEVLESDSVKVTLLRGALCRFRLLGPLAHQVAVHAFQVPREAAARGDVTRPARWWHGVYEDVTCRELHAQQYATWQALSGVAGVDEVPPGCVLGLTVHDPRLHLPKTRLNLPLPQVSVVEPRPAPPVLPSDVSWSPLWSARVRDDVKTQRLSDAQLNMRRHEHGLPGCRLELGDEENRVPLLLVQQPGAAGGWDVVAPGGWGGAVWLALVYHGGRPAGLREAARLAAEAGRLHFPDDYPDTRAGAESLAQESHGYRSKYARMPPAKRVNYMTMGCVVPHTPPWRRLVREWGGHTETGGHPECDEPLIVRDREYLGALSQLCAPATGLSTKRRKVTVAGSGPEADDSLPMAFNVFHPQQRCGRDTLKAAGSASESLPSRAGGVAGLVAVCVRMVGRGVPCYAAMLCVPTADDLATWRRGEGRRGDGLLEPKHRPEAGRARGDKCVTTAGATYLQPRARGKEKKKKAKKGEEAVAPIVDIRDTARAASADLYESESANCPSVRESCCREILGFVLRGGQSLVTGRGRGVGYVCEAGLRAVLGHKGPAEPAMLLLRCPNSLQYRLAEVRVIPVL